MTQNHPIALYKYKDISGEGIEHVEDMLRSNRIWFSSPLSFNDPFDCRAVFDVSSTREEIVFRKAAFLAKRKGASLADALAAANTEIPSKPDEVERWQIQQVEAHSRRAANTGILCLTPVCDNFIMWTHYAKDHTGICIGFRVRDVHAEAGLDFIGAAQKVEYADRCPLINFVQDGNRETVRKAFLTKATPFRHEHEWRIVQYDQGAGLKPIPNGIIGVVILGCRIDRSPRERVVNACATYDGDIEIVQSRLDPDKYGLTMELEEIV